MKSVHSFIDTCSPTQKPLHLGEIQCCRAQLLQGDSVSPFLWSPEPNGKGWSRVAPSENFNFYHQMGNLGLVRHLP